LPLFQVAVVDAEFAIVAYPQLNQAGRKAAFFETGHGGQLGEAPPISQPAASECNRAI
jgi:hypothetical protein